MFSVYTGNTKGLTHPVAGNEVYDVLPGKGLAVLLTVNVLFSL